MFVNFNILNQLGSPAINSNTFANRPAAGQTGRLFVSTDTFEIYRDNGTTWDLIGGPGSSTVTGTGAATQVAYWTAAQSIGGSNNLWWDNTSGFLGVGNNAPTARIEAVKTDGIGIYSNYTTNAGSGSSATAIWAKNVTNSSGYGAVIEETTPNATAGQYPLLIKHSLSSGTAGVGMGTGVHWQLPDDAGTFKTTQLTVETINAAAATYATRYRFNVQSNGSSTPVAYLNATGLGIFTATPGAALDIHSTGTIAQLNSTGTTNNGYLAFQRTGATTFSIGDTYNGGSNYFRIFGSALSADIVRIFAATGESFFTSTETYSSGNSIGVSVQNNLTIPNGVNVGLAALGGVNSNLNLSLGGSTTVANTGRQGLEGSTTIGFTGAGTLTMTQGSTVRAFSALSSVYAFNGSAVGTITHLAGLRICFPDNVGSAVNITNNYALLINNQTTGTGTVTYTNRWGIYQEGASDLNYMAANLLLGSTTNSGEKLQVTGTALISNQLTVNSSIFSQTGFGGTFKASDGTNTVNFGSYFNTIGVGNSYDGVIYTTNASSALYIMTGGSITPKLTLTSGGLFGIGTTTPSEKLDVRGNIYTNATNTNLYLDNGGPGGASLKIGVTGSTSTYINSQDAHPILFLTTNTERMRITSGGSINILSTSTNTTFTSGGTLGIKNSAGDPYISWHANDGTRIGYLQMQGSGVAGLSIDVNQPLAFYTNATERMRIASGGNVLIGTTTDAGQKLQVNGDIKIGYTKTASGNTGSINNATATTMFAITGGLGLWLVACNLPAGNGSPTLYTAFATIVVDGLTTPRIINNNGSLLTITLSGTNVQVTQTSGGTQAGGVDWVYQKIG